MSDATKQEWRRNRRRIARETRAILVERFPACFMPKREPKRPLKTGIRGDILRACRDISQRHLHIALDDYTTGPRYLEALVEGATRIALDGSEAGVVTPMQARRAAGELAAAMKRFAKAEAVRESRVAA